MSILQSPRVKDGSQNMEVSAFVVDMTWKSWFYRNALTERSAWLSFVCPLFFPFMWNSKTPADLFACSCVLAFPTSRWLHKTSATTWCSTCEPCKCGPDRRGCSTPGSCSNWEPFTCTHCSGKKNKRFGSGACRCVLEIHSLGQDLWETSSVLTA